MALTRFRISAHSLAIETGRHHRKARRERKCIYCNMNVIESEYHFLLICPLYNDIRTKYLPRYYFTWPTVNKFNHRRSTTGLIFFFFFFCIFTRLETLTICLCNYITLKTFSINPQSTLVYGLLYRQGRKRGVLV